MSLINCTECKKKVSSKASACPHCGAPVVVFITPKGSTWRRKAGIALAVLIALTAYGHYNNWSQQRAAKKAERDEFWRRSQLTPEQRIAEDKARQEKLAAQQAEAQRQAAIEARATKTKTHQMACLSALTSTLHDPGSFSLIKHQGYVEGNQYSGFIDGRAKNSFGALIVATWQCESDEYGGNVIVRTLKQVKP